MHLRWSLSQAHQQTHVQANLSFNHGSTDMRSLRLLQYESHAIYQITHVKQKAHQLIIKLGKAHQWHTNEATCESATCVRSMRRPLLSTCLYTPTEHKGWTNPMLVQWWTTPHARTLPRSWTLGSSRDSSNNCTSSKPELVETMPRQPHDATMHHALINSNNILLPFGSSCPTGDMHLLVPRQQWFGFYGWRSCGRASLLLFFILLDSGQSAFRYFDLLPEATKLVMAAPDQRQPCLGCILLFWVHAAPQTLEFLAFIQ